MTEIKITASLEDYLEALFEIFQEKQGVRAVDVAKRLNVKKSSVTEALKNLSSKGLVNYGKYDVISLTDEGKKIAMRVIEKHKIIFDFLKNVLGAEAKEASENACKIEHIISDEILNRLISFIQYCKNENEKEFLNSFKKHYENK